MYQSYLAYVYLHYYDFYYMIKKYNRIKDRRLYIIFPGLDAFIRRHCFKMKRTTNLRNDLLFSSIAISFVLFLENSIASEGRIQALTQQNAKLPTLVDKPGKPIFINKFS